MKYMLLKSRDFSGKVVWNFVFPSIANIYK
jgi:hypothetical protein